MTNRFSLIPFLVLGICVSLCLGLVACESHEGDGATDDPLSQEGLASVDIGCGWSARESMPIQYATQFAVDYFEGGYKLLRIADGQRLLVVPEGAEVPSDVDDDVVVLEQPLTDIYLVASDAGCLFDALGSLDAVSVSGVARQNWRVPALASAMESGKISYGGKYNAPDYDALLASGVRLSIQSTMINHAPEVREKLVDLGIPVMVERSSLEQEPLGRTEWVKFYGALLGKEDLAERLFAEQAEKAHAAEGSGLGKTVAFFYINSNGAAVVRRPGDYVARMIEQAGGDYVFKSLEDDGTARSTLTMEMERFYAQAKEADIVVYNATIDSGVDTLDDLVGKNELLANFKAVKSGDVWVTEQDMYQQMISTGDIISDFNAVFSGWADDLTYLRRLE